MATDMRLGVDTGGTFTDFVLLDDDGHLGIHKVLSTPDAPERAILQGIVELGLAGKPLQLVHGSTIATNAALEGKGVDTLYITNRGFADVLTIGRQQRAALYDLQPLAKPPPVASTHCLETGGRISADGELLDPLTDHDLGVLRKAFEQQRPQAVAVNLLFSYLDDAAERRIASVLPADVFISLSSSVLPEIREYERGMATWLNAWVGPLVAGYLARLAGQLDGAPISVMQSSGDTVAAEQAAQQAVRMLLSGPAGGLIAAQRIGETSHAPNLLTFDMGGTSTDVALVDGAPRLTTEGHIGRYPVAVPMVDMHTIGAGGGSIAWLDAGGMLQVGPQSAGASPGPACYGKHGKQPTVTDANLLLGRLLPKAFLGGEMTLDVAAAKRAFGSIAADTGQSIEQLAQDVIAVANEHMAQALRAISIKRGIDPAGHVLLSFGGAGGLHVCALADALGMSEALVPRFGGVLSALGMLAARPGRQLSRSHVVLLKSLDDDQLAEMFDALRREGVQALRAEGFDEAACDAQVAVDLRYAGQSYTLNVDWQGIAASTEAFHQLHAERYGHRLALPVELVNLRVAVRGPATDLVMSALPDSADGLPFDHCAAFGVETAVPAYWRHQLAPGQQVSGPSLICEDVATTWLAPGWTLLVDPLGHLLLARSR